MKIIIPMSGSGQRFKNAGYKTLKPLIEVDGKPIIAHVINLFSQEDEFIFICNKDHLRKNNMREILEYYCPKGTICPIEPHKKGPVYAVSKILKYLNDEDEVIVNYCDFSCYWDYANFKKFIKKEELDGCIPAYKDFHPHSLGSTNYAYIKEHNNNLIDIQEKKPFTKNKMEEYASSGTYYFSKGKYVKKYFTEAINKNLSTNGEYYCSLVYKLMSENNLKTKVYELKYFMQWGTPTDLEIYKNWSNLFKKFMINKKENEILFDTTIISMAGEGSRFSKLGYGTPKPLIKVSNLPMFIQAAKSLPKSKKYRFVCKNNLDISESKTSLKKYFQNYSFTKLNTTPPGQAISTYEGIKNLNKGLINISACDHGVIFDNKKLKKILEEKNFDILVWTKRGYIEASLNPNMYSWVLTESDKIKNVSVKKSLSNPIEDHLLIGTFTFLNKEIYIECFKKLLDTKEKVNNEIYIDSMINFAIKKGYRCKIFEVDEFICWGTPNEFKTFEYWRNCFNLLKSHPYKSNNEELF